MYRILVGLAACLCGMVVWAQETSSRVGWNLTAMTEGEWSMTNGKTSWINYLEAGVDVGLWKGAAFEGMAIATYQAGGAVDNDNLGLSNIYTDENKPLRLMQASLRQVLGKYFSVSLGLRNVDADYFTTPATGLFTGAANADYPILSLNYPLATFPLSAMGIHVECLPMNGLTLKASVYNGVASDAFNRQFRFCPASDGVFSLGCISYELPSKGEQAASYTLGYVYGKTPSEDGSVHEKETGFWGLLEQPLVLLGKSQLVLLGQGAAMTSRDIPCNGYWGGGLVMNRIARNDMTAGIVFNRLLFADGDETDIECTIHCHITSWLSLQPALHIIHHNKHNFVAGLLRLSLELGNEH